RALVDDGRACWRFVEHRRDDPLLPPEVGWMQGAAGIAAFLWRTARVLRQGQTAPAVARMDTWWGLPGA
ncbi:MAG: lanthionine synthetase, partial [Actinomycetota bacterium]|nr:lanthionine synthetase [Actinomycetota bacterium]